MRPDKSTERDPRFNLQRGEAWRNGARVVKNFAPVQKRQRRKRGH